MPTSVENSTFVSDTVLVIRDDLRANITDPESSKRPSGEHFVMTSYPQRQVVYPLITVRLLNYSGPQRLGMQSDLHYITLLLEVRIWARNQIEKDKLTQLVTNRLRSNEFGGTGTIAKKLYGLQFLSGVNVDETGDNAPKSRVIELQYNYVLGG